MASKKRLADANLLLAMVIMVMFVISLTTGTKNPLLFTIISLSIILGGINNIKLIKPGIIGYFTLFIGIFLFIMSLSSLLKY
ncbi:hypothetical protein CN692_06205 [Bacillus sp. AFS002410]|uniref:hypothetical protein n=1 Tax=Bacillus sp. AFS002410 TaxID=2033481 RepID=UPI000BF23F12|nr:hypothetical protein [Bacillus sp. AFS002410]PEJ59069.1 hypothetical protein CN692_06205 [Bacillus sp. AFS002410]